MKGLTMSLQVTMGARRHLFVLVAGCSLLGCTLKGPPSAGPATETFRHALSVCRFQHTGATNQKVALPATEEHIRSCLAKRGWLPSGEAAPALGPGG
jgi:hypothetical protein